MSDARDPHFVIRADSRAHFVWHCVDALAKGGVRAHLTELVPVGRRVVVELVPPPGLGSSASFELNAIVVRHGVGGEGDSWLSVMDGAEETLRRLLRLLDGWDSVDVTRPKESPRPPHSSPSGLLRAPTSPSGILHAPNREEFERRLRSNEPMEAASEAVTHALTVDQQRLLGLVRTHHRFSALLIACRDWLSPPALIALLHECHQRGALRFPH